MVSPSASMPIVIIFERHWEKIPRQIVKDLIPKLSEEGYDTFCFEFPQNLKEKEILSLHNEALESDKDLNSKAENCLARVGIKNIRLDGLDLKNLSNLMRLYVSRK